MLSPVGDHILQDFNALNLTRFRTYKLLDHPKQKTRNGGGLRQINTCRKVLLQVNFLDYDILLRCLYSLLVHGQRDRIPLEEVENEVKTCRFKKCSQVIFTWLCVCYLDTLF